MLYHGIDKLRGGMDGVEEMLTMMDVPAPALSAPLVTALEVIGGIPLLAGLGTRLAAASLAAVLTGALIFVKTDLGIIASGRCLERSSTSRCSPTVLVDGTDPFARGDEPVGLSCRIYQTPDGPAGSPSLAQLAAVLGVDPQPDHVDGG